MTDDATVLHPPLRLRLRAGLRKPANWLALVRFALVGASGYVVNLAVFALAVHALGFDYRVAAVLAFLVAVTNNFVWNRRWTFAARDGHAGLPGRALPGRLARRLRRQPRDPHRPGERRRAPTRRRAGDRDRGRHAAELRRQQALELPGLMRRAAARRGGTRRAGPARHRRHADDARAAQEPRSASRPPGYRLTGARPSDRRPHAEGRPRSAAPTAAPSTNVFVKSGRALAGQLLQRRAAGGQGARAGLRQRRHRPGHRGVDGSAGRVDDGPRLPGRVRAQGQLALGVDPAHAALRRALRRPAPAAARAPPRPRGARRLRRRVAFFNDANIDVSVPLVYPLLAYLLGAHAVDRAAAAGAGATRCACSCPATWLVGRAASSSSASASG